MKLVAVCSLEKFASQVLIRNRCLGGLLLVDIGQMLDHLNITTTMHKQRLKIGVCDI